MASQVYVPAVIVLPLKVLATREVIRERMAYKDYLGGNVREELDRLNGFEGKFLIDTSEMMVKREGKNLSKEEWRYMKRRMPTDVISFLNGKKDFHIVERKGRLGEREWALRDVDNSSKKLQLGRRIAGEAEGWEYREEFFADGAIITFRNFYNKDEFLLGEVDTFKIYNGGIIRTKVWDLPKHNMRIKKKMFAHKENNYIFPTFFLNLVVELGLKYFYRMR